MELDDNRVQDYQITIWWPCDHHIYDDHHMYDDYNWKLCCWGGGAPLNGEWEARPVRWEYSEYLPETNIIGVSAIIVCIWLFNLQDWLLHPPIHRMPLWNLELTDQDDCDYYIDCDHEDDYGDDDDAMKWFVEINVYLSMSAWPCGISITGWNWNLVKSGCSNDGDGDSNSILIYWCPTGGKLVRVACVRKLFASYVNAPPSPM